ncbi:MAG: NAD(P)H-dependent oxidoreductase [Phycisphaerae bacterium]|nr:NAD(P)H-dependent oxidoreductase [Phycisphaerae bacterium]
MRPISPEVLIEQLKWRYATKRFDSSKKISPDVWSALEQSLVLTPSSFGLQPWRFVVVTNQAMKESLVPHSWNQTQPAECSHYVVFAARHSLSAEHVDHYLARIAEVRGVAVDSLAGFRGILIGALVPPAPGFEIRQWAALQAYIALGNFMTSAAMLGVDTCPMEGIVPAEYDNLLQLPADGFRTVVACAAGYRTSDDKYAKLPKVRFPAEEVVRHV